MYNKLFAKIVLSSIWLEPLPTRIVWIAFLATMDEDGFVQCSAIGNVASLANVTIDEARAAIETLESPDPESGNPDHEGRRIERIPGGWIVLNAKAHRDIVTREMARERTRQRVRKHRESRRCNADVTDGNENVTPSETDTETESEPQTDNPPTPLRGKPPAGRRQLDLQAVDQDKLRLICRRLEYDYSLPVDADTIRQYAAIALAAGCKSVLVEAARSCKAASVRSPKRYWIGAVKSAVQEAGFDLPESLNGTGHKQKVKTK